MSHSRNNSDWDKSPGSGNTDDSEVSVLPRLFQDLQLGCGRCGRCGRCVLCPRCRDRRRDARCRRWIEECSNAYLIACENRDRNPDQNQDSDKDKEGEGDGDGNGDGDGCSTWWLQETSRPGPCYSQGNLLPSEPPQRTRQHEEEGRDLQWPHPLELALEVTAGFTLLSLLGEENSEMLLPPLALFVLYVLLTLPLAMVLGGRRRSRR